MGALPKIGSSVPRHRDSTSTARTRRLRRLFSDEFLRRHLAYKTGWYGSGLHVANRFYPPSKTCSGCGTGRVIRGTTPEPPMRPKLSLAEPMFTCTTCGLVLDRDLNAARNLARLVGHGTGSAPETGAGDGSNARGDPVSPTPHQRGGHESRTPDYRAGRPAPIWPLMCENARVAAGSDPPDLR
jgi:putative transposase